MYYNNTKRTGMSYSFEEKRSLQCKREWGFQVCMLKTQVLYAHPGGKKLLRKADKETKSLHCCGVVEKLTHVLELGTLAS